MASKTSSHWPITSTNGAAALFNLFLPLVLVRILTPDQMGRYKIFFLYVMLSPGLFLVSGLNNGLYHWAGKYPATKSEVRQSWTLLLGITFIFCAIGLIFSRWFAPFIKISSLDLRLLLLCVPFLLFSAFLEDIFGRDRCMRQALMYCELPASLRPHGGPEAWNGSSAFLSQAPLFVRSQAGSWLRNQESCNSHFPGKNLKRFYGTPCLSPLQQSPH